MVKTLPAFITPTALFSTYQDKVEELRIIKIVRKKYHFWLTGIMRHIRSGVEQSMDAMAAVASYHTVTMRLNVFLDDITNLTEAFAWFNDLNGLRQCFVCDLH